MSAVVENKKETRIHPTAIVDSSAVLGEGVEIGAYSVIGPNVRIGDGCWISHHVVIEGLTTIAESCRIFQFASVGSEPQDLKYGGEASKLHIGKKNIIREYVTLQPGTEGGGMLTQIGDDNLFMASAHVGHDCIVGNGNILANSAALSGHVVVMNHAIIGGLVGVHQFTRIGSHSFLSGGSMVRADVPPYCFGQGDSCQLRGINMLGLERRGYSKEQISAIRKAYRHFFSSVGGLQEKIDTLPKELAAEPKVQTLVEFIKSSKRGVCAPAKNLSSSE